MNIPAYLSPPLLTQGMGSGIATLQQREEAEPIIPQAGTLAPIACPEPCEELAGAADNNSWLWLLLLAGGVLLMSQRKRGERRHASSGEQL